MPRPTAIMPKLNPLATAAAPIAQRLISLDALRGFDMFWIVGGRELLLAFLALFVSPLPAALTVQFEHTELAGVYDAKVGEAGAVLKFAAQSDASESSLDELSTAQLATLKNVANVVAWTPNLSLRGMMERGRTGSEFWMPVLLAVLAIAAVETFLGQWFSRSK